MGFWSAKPSAPPDQSAIDPIVGGGAAAATPSVQETKAELVAQGDDHNNSVPKGSSSASGGGGASGCPMHRADGSYSFDVRALWRMGFPHAPGGSHPLTPEQATAARSATQESPPVEPAPTSSVTRPSSGGGCPVKQQKNISAHHPEYNVYAQAVDPTNQMPFQPNQLPAPTQSVPLSTERVASTIPKVRARIVLDFAACILLSYCI
jgi:Cytochrome c/c1 heme lyase